MVILLTIQPPPGRELGRCFKGEEGTLPCSRSTRNTAPSGVFVAPNCLACNPVRRVPATRCAQNQQRDPTLNHLGDEAVKKRWT